MPLSLFPRISAVACSLGSLPPFALQSIPRTANAGGLEHRNQMRPPVCPEPANVLAHLKSKALGRLQGPTRLSPYFPTSPLVPCHSIRPIALHLLLPWPLCHCLKTFSLPKCLTSRHPDGSQTSRSWPTLFLCFLLYIYHFDEAFSNSPILFIYQRFFLMRTIFWLS